MNITRDEFSKRLERNVDPDRWSSMPKICAELTPKPISFDEKRLETLFSFETTNWMGNPIKWLHGGIISTIFDNAMGSLATVISEGNFTPTVTLQVNYLRPVPLEGNVYVLARVTKPGRSLIYTCAELYAEIDSDTPLATATAVYAIHRTEKI